MNFWQLPNAADKLAVIDSETNVQLSYYDLNLFISLFSQKLAQFNQKTLGIIFCKNNIDTLVAYLASLKLQHCVFLLDAELNCELANRLVEAYQPDWIILPKNIKATFENYQIQTNFLNSNFCIAKVSPNKPIDFNLALLLSTSGSTGSPKVVRLSYKNLAENAASIAKYLSLSEWERPITTLPLHYSYGLSVINSHLLVNATLLLTQDGISTREFWEFAKKNEVTSLAGVPYTYQILQQIRMENIALPTLKTLTQAGGRLHSHLVKHFLELSEQKGWQFYVMYGQTEATARICYVPPNLLKNKLDAIGLPIPNGKLTIDPETSELIYEGPNVMMGYAQNRQDLAKGDELNGLLKTGDLARLDEDGFFHITGRSKRFLKLFGLRINLEEVEIMLESECRVAAAATGDDEKLHIFIENQEQEKTVKALISNRYKLHPTAIKVHSVQSIPRGARGKPDYLKLQTMIKA